MKTLQSIRHHFNQWQNKPSPDNVINNSKVKNSSSSIDKNKPLIFQWICKIHSPVMVLLSISTITGLVSYRFYNQPELAVGTISPTKIIAPADGDFLDEKTTEELRRKTRSGLLPVLQQDITLTQTIRNRINRKLEEIDTLRRLINEIPVINQNILPLATQKYLYSISTSEWEQMITDINNSPSSLSENPEIKPLLAYKQKVNNDEFQQTFTTLQQYRHQYQNSLKEFKQQNIHHLTDDDIKILLNVDSQTWQKTKIAMEDTSKKILTQGISPGLPEEIKYRTLQIHLENNVSPEVKNLAIDLLSKNLDSNLTIDEEETKIRGERAALAIQPVVVSVRKNEVIVDAGEKITQTDFVLLDNFNLSRRSINWTGVAGSSVLVTISVFSFMSIANKIKGKLRRRDQVLLWLLSLSVPIISIFDVGYNSLPALGFLVSSFYGPSLALTNVTLMTGLTLFQIEMIGWEYLISSFAGGILASFMASRLHSREELALLGAGVGLTQGSTFFIVQLISTAATGTVWYTLLPPAIWHGTVGLTYSILALGISPYLERFFDLITPIRLAELSNTNRPLLKRLATEAPGTFQHTMFVASLAEAAARQLHCNIELIRAGTLYHDIGKMHDPFGFIENQMGGPNKHDMINDPYESANIIKKHVSEGIVMAKKCGLPQAIIDFIPQHQGTLLISYFYYQAKTQAEGEGKNLQDIDETIFRYDGPIPQTRETAIVMLADGCEAALRSLKDATPDQAMAMVNKIFKARWRDHQLDDSGIKYEELPIVAEVFVNVWQQFNHQRISYPKGALEMRSSK
ncbi:HD family phosphohydrolase [Geminocystis herdmanii]|uniref:HD family phosphohydrolase n=1 Tax=Geminocystis herdmanii TaxID=669359 RepID=UPI00034B8CBE|nr:HDIG domain-containing metalloprotein [Geminocystis herdmanii]